MLTFIRRSPIGMIRYQCGLALRNTNPDLKIIKKCGLALNLGLWRRALKTQVHLTLSAPPSCRQHPSSLGIESYSHQETDAYLLPRGFGSEWARRIGNCSQTTDGGWKPCSAQAGIDIVAADISRTIDIPSAQRTDCNTTR